MSGNKRIAVVGAGQMGSGIAHAFATTGHDVVLVDRSDAILKTSSENIVRIIDEGVARGKVSEEAAAKARSTLTCQTDLVAAATDAGLVIETASENLDIKLDIVRTVDTVLGDDAVIATNTSALSITEIAAATRAPERFIGMHFFNPVHKMKLVEIVRGLATSDKTVEKVRAWSDAIGKTSILVNEAPGFTTSRMSSLMGNEAMWMLYEGVASAEDIDTSLRMAFNYPMGPLELGDLTGWDTRYSVMQYLHRTLGERYRPCPLIGKMVAAGRYGRKVGHGVYRYEDGQKVPHSGLKPS